MGLANILYDTELFYRITVSRTAKGICVNQRTFLFKRKGSSCRVLAALNL